MAKSHAVLLKLVALRAYGDVGPYTVYTRKDGNMVWYKRSPPHKAPSIRQNFQRARFKISMLDWKLLPAQDRLDWELISKRTSVPYTGLNLFMMMQMREDMRTEITSYCREADFPGPPGWRPR